MLPLLLDADPAQATNVRLVSLARAFVAGYELVSSVAPAGEFGTEETFRNRIDSLFWVLSERSEHEPDTAIRSRMVHAMYSLACKTVFPADLRKKNCCYRAADALVRDFMGVVGARPENGLFQQTGVCMCAADLLYPAPAADDEYLLFLKRQLAGWTSALDADGCWPGGVVRGRIGTYRGDEPGCLDVSRLGERYRDKAGGGVLPQVRMRPCRPPEFRRGVPLYAGADVRGRIAGQCPPCR